MAIKKTRFRPKGNDNYETIIHFETSADIVKTTDDSNVQSKLDNLEANKLDKNANAISASKLKTARTISLTGDASGSVSFDGSADVSLNVSVKDDSHNHIISNIDGLQSILDSKETPSGAQAKANQALNDAKSYTDNKMAELVSSAPETLDTLNELAEALGKDPNFATTITTELGKKASKTDLDSHKNNKSNPHNVTVSQIGAETPSGAQAKADTAEANAKNYADTIVETVANELTSHKNETASLIKIKKDVIILASGWFDDTANSGFWIYNIEDEDITEDTIVDVNIHLADLEKASDIKSSNLSSSGKVTIYADEQLTEDIVCDLKLIRQVV